jgi:prolyl-tRNA editing enzyme YbaK/EbsC (Cys-tRNA(Pro) deacylase)
MAKPSGLERFQAATADLDLVVSHMDQSTHTAAEAAAAVGAPVEAIVKSLLFMAHDEPLLVLASGPNRVNAEALGARLGCVVAQADARAVKAHTGWSIGGVPPFGHPTPLRTVMDEDFFRLETVWAAAGSAQSVFPITPARLQELTAAEIVSVV